MSQEKTQKPITLPDPYRRALSSGFSVMEELLFDLLTLVYDNPETGVFTRKTTSLSLDQRHRLRREIHDILVQLRQIKNELRLQERVESPKSLIMSRSSKVWEILCDLKTDRLRGYGKPPEGLSDYLDTRIDQLLDTLKRIGKVAETEDSR